jgi:hypothetical protein
MQGSCQGVFVVNKGFSGVPKLCSMDGLPESGRKGISGWIGEQAAKSLHKAGKALE